MGLLPCNFATGTFGSANIGWVFEGGVTDVGEAGCKKVVLNALANMCEHCDIIGEPESYHYYVYVEDDIIKSVEPATGEFSFGDDEDDFLVLEK